ncbi:MAG: PTS 2-O-a-mannosyl-D-glycerate transporter subunit IIABC [Streptococcaceae bacterium]|jgi:2-O-A-mannosyl-D-glycerate-specific PTS system IIC component|nr:PTS 2-O-a-mannosyl-D-glycerate transporter subunit IIABC [Streptococcaceae bacterium]
MDTSSSKDLSAATSRGLIFLNQAFTTKSEIFDFVAEQFVAQGIVTSAEEFKQALYVREDEGLTGFENGLAIPHGKSGTVLKASFAVIRLKQALPAEEYVSLNPENRVDTLFVLAIPEKEAAKHLDLLAKLSTQLADEKYLARLKAAKNPDQIFELLSENIEDQSLTTAVSESKGLILGITACAAGIAHTYMAAEAIAKKAAELGYEAKIEKQGANGLEDRITTADVARAVGIIYAHDVTLKDLQRFDALAKVDVKVAEPIRNPEKVIADLLNTAANHTKSADHVVRSGLIEETEEIKGFWTIVKDSVLTGISYIIPIIIAGGMIGAFAVMITQIFHLQSSMVAPVAPQVNTFWLFTLKTLGSNMLGVLMVPILSAYMAYSIADKPGLAPGFAAGLAATAINSGFLGGMLGGLVAGFLMKWMKEHIKTAGVFKGFVSFWVYPVVGTLVTAILMLFIIGQPVAWLNTALLDFLKSMQGSNALLLGAIIGVMVSFDLGGPVNKAAYAFCLGAMASGNFIPYAIFASVKMVSAFSLSAAMFIKKDIWTAEEREIGTQTWILGFAGITEGAIPVAMGDPIRVLGSFIGGSLVTGAIVASANIGLTVPGAGIFSLALLQGGNLLTSDLVWFGAALIGAAISTLLLIMTRQAKLKKVA